MTNQYRHLGLIALLISYGSLYPFSFSAASPGAFGRLFSEVRLFGSLGDLLGNIGLFVPWGLVGMASMAPRNGVSAALTKTVAIGFALALGLQIAQIWVPARSAGLNDVVWNMVGCAMGIALGQFVLSHRYRLSGLPAAQQLPACIVAAWIVIEWLPLVPSLDFQLVKNHLKGLLSFELMSFGHIFERVAMTLLLGELLSRLGKPGRSLFLLPTLVAGVLLGKLFLVDTQVSPSMVIGSALGVTGWWGIYRLPADRRSLVVVVALVAAFSVQALSPFALRDAPSSFGWLPFEGLLEGSMLNNVRSLGNSVLLFASVLLLLRATGSSTSVASIGLAFWVAIMELMQLFIATRSASITEPLLVLIVGQLIRAVDSPEQNERAPRERRPEQQATTRRRTPATLPTRRAAVISALVIVAVIAVGLKVLLQLPTIPYNVKELFRGNGSVPALIVFAMALLWIGAGAVWLGRSLIRSRSPGLLLAPLTMAVSLVSLTLLWSGVSSESIGDIAGASNRFWFVTNKNIWGDVWRDLFLYLDAPEVIGFLETCVRYWALYTPLIVCLGLMIYVQEHRVERAHSRPAQLALAVSALLLLWLCKAIAFDWSSTDNLNELIAYDGEWGWGGGGYLYALLFLLCLNATLLAQSSIGNSRRLGATALFSLAAIPVGWWLINQGLEQSVEKYGAVFSGVQFLLGPDRTHLLSQDTLLLRWCAVQIAGTLLLGLGLRLGQQAFSQPDNTLPAPGNASP